MKRWLVTGGAGFLGSHLTEALLVQGDSVVVLDDFSTGNRENLQHLFNYETLEVIEHDVLSPISVDVDGIFNLASPASPIQYQRLPVKTIKTNVLGAINMLELAHSSKIKILQSSTSEVYGDPNVSPQAESYWGNVNPIGIRSCYDEGKRVAETLFFDYHRQYGLEIKIARIFNTYGPRMDPHDGRVVSNFLVQALRGEPITIYGDGLQTRSFCYVQDLISGLIRLMNSPSEITGPINIGNPNEFTMIELAEKIIEITKSRSRIEFQDLPADDPKQRKPDVRLAEKLLGWKPKIQLEEGLKLMLADFSFRV